MTAIDVPLDAIDPAAVTSRWTHQFEWHLDVLPPLMDAIVTTTLPSIAAAKLEARVSGGGHIDNMTRVLAAFDQTDQAEGIQAGGAAADARHLWGMVVEYLDAAAAWTAQTTAPTLNPKPDADPLTARALAFTAISWLIDNANRIQPITELEPYRDDLFTLIRRLRGRYGVTPHSRRPRARCTTCGITAVTVTWIDSPTGSPKPIQAARCKNCGETYEPREESDHA